MRSVHKIPDLTKCYLLDTLRSLEPSEDLGIGKPLVLEALRKQLLFQLSQAADLIAVFRLTTPFQRDQKVDSKPHHTDSYLLPSALQALDNVAPSPVFICDVGGRPCKLYGNAYSTMLPLSPPAKSSHNPSKHYGSVRRSKPFPRAIPECFRDKRV